MPYLPLLAALAFALSPYLIGSFGGFDPAAFPIPQDEPPVQPVGWAFSIWGLIYVGLIAHAAFGAFRRADDPAWAATRLPLTVSLLVGALWIPAAKASPPLATMMILLMLATALVAWRRTPVADRLWAEVPLGLYAGWLLAASCVSLGILAAGYGLVGPLVAAVAALALAIVAGYGLLHLRASAALPAALAWAFAGIAVQNVGGSAYVLCLAAAAATIMAVRSVRNLRRR